MGSLTSRKVNLRRHNIKSFNYSFMTFNWVCDDTSLIKFVLDDFILIKPIVIIPKSVVFVFCVQHT